MARQSRTRRRRPATSPEMREMELANAAYDLAEEQIESGTASSQVLTHFLKAGSGRERLEQERIRHEIELAKVKKDQIQSQERMQEMFVEALDAMRGYRPALGAETVDGTVDGE